MTLTDNGNKFFGADLVEFPVAVTGNGDTQGGDVKTCVFGLGGGIEGRGIRNDSDHRERSFKKFLNISSCDF